MTLKSIQRTDDDAGSIGRYSAASAAGRQHSTVSRYTCSLAVVVVLPVVN